MRALFPAWSNTAYRLALAALVGGALASVIGLMWYARTPWAACQAENNVPVVGYFGRPVEAPSLQKNPDVTARAARREERGIRQGEVVTACLQACATQIIQFGALEHAGTAIRNLNPELEG